MNKSETSLGSRIFPWTKVRWKPHSFVGRVDFFKSLYSQLAGDLKNELGCQQLDALILSGDIANRSTPEEYAAARQFLKKLADEFRFDLKQTIIVPGNHDLNWALAKKAYNIKQRLAQSGFSVAFHGHIHKAETDAYQYDHGAGGGRRIHIVCAGTFGAPTRDCGPG
ncbi:MAG: hypothetical protein GY862_27265, partial [Gammaproteobacteria bacterium]|nr:hypothetical protein [Gammaproteobacteria bacterium]